MFKKGVEVSSRNQFALNRMSLGNGRRALDRILPNLSARWWRTASKKFDQGPDSLSGIEHSKAFSRDSLPERMAKEFSLRLQHKSDGTIVDVVTHNLWVFKVACFRPGTFAVSYPFPFFKHRVWILLALATNARVSMRVGEAVSAVLDRCSHDYFSGSPRQSLFLLISLSESN